MKLHMVGYRRSSDYWEQERRDKANAFRLPLLILSIMVALIMKPIPVKKRG